MCKSRIPHTSQLQLGTLRYGMIDLIKNPVPGFEEVIASHFRLLRRRIMATVRKWVQDAGAVDDALQRRMDLAVCELHGLLAKL